MANWTLAPGTPKRSPWFLLSAVFVLASGLSAKPSTESARVQFQALHGASARPKPSPGKILWKAPLAQGATATAKGTRFVLRSEKATRVELELFGQFAKVRDDELSHRLATPQSVVVLQKKGDLFVADVPGVRPGEVYGYRIFGPNWPHQEGFQPGTEVGFVADVDAQGNRFCPNKLLIDPYARALTKDPKWKGKEHASGPGNRQLDNAATAAKAIVIEAPKADQAKRKRRLLKDTVVYEVHVRGMTKLFPDIPDAGTYKALAHPRVIQYLKGIGVTAIELLPIHETLNDWNDEAADSKDDNYWGYMTLSYFAPDRRLAADQSAGGPVREFRQMVDTLHANGLEVYLDVVYNHHAEGGHWKLPKEDGETATLYSLRGVDNALYYELAGGKRHYYDNTGIGANLQTANPKVQEFILDSLHYWSDQMGVDGFRFDLCSVLGNRIRENGFAFQKTGGFLDRIAKSFGHSNNDAYENGHKVKLIAEPWAIFDDTYQVGNFPWGWAEWNGKYRGTVREFIRGHSSGQELRDAMNGSYHLFGDDGRKPFQSINFLTAHDGLTLFDLVSYNVNSKGERDPLNNRQWPYGPSDGGEENNHSWNSTIPGQSPAATAALRRQRARMAMAILMLSNGTPMVLGGDERLRTKHGNNNTYNLDNEVNYLHWGPSQARLDAFPDRVNHLDKVKMSGQSLARTHRFFKNLIRFRRAHPSFHPADWWSSEGDADQDGYPAAAWFSPQAKTPDAKGLAFALRLDADPGDLRMASSEAKSYPLAGQDLLILVNGSPDEVSFQLPKPSPGKGYQRVMDTHAWAEAEGNYWPEGKRQSVEGTYGVQGRSVVVLIEADAP